MLCRWLLPFNATLTGRPECHAPMAANGSTFVYDFDPYPPPRTGERTRTLLSGSAKMRARSSRTMNGCWAVVMTSTPSPLTVASAFFSTDANRLAFFCLAGVGSVDGDLHRSVAATTRSTASPKSPGV